MLRYKIMQEKYSGKIARRFFIPRLCRSEPQARKPGASQAFSGAVYTNKKGVPLLHSLSLSHYSLLVALRKCLPLYVKCSFYK